MANELQVILDEQNVAKENAQALIKAFGAPFEEAGEILSTYESIVVTDEEQFDLMAQAREKRLTLKKIRTSVENKRKELKEDSLRTGKAIDSVAKFIKETIEPAEEYLELQEKFGEIKAAERKAALKAERIEKLSKYTEDISFYNVDELNTEQFDTLLGTLKNQYEAKIAEAKKIEQDRIAQEKAEAKERERIRQENERLKAEAVAREAEVAKERKETEAHWAKVKAEQDAKLEEERKKREAIEAEKSAQAAEEQRRKDEAEEANRKALLAPDKEKLIAFANVIDALQAPNVSNREAGKVLDETTDFLNRISKNLRNKAKEL